MTPTRLDPADRRILDELQHDARISNVVLAERVGLSPSPCHRRVRLIEESGLIRRYVALLDRRRIGLELTAFIEVALGSKNPATVATFERAIAARPEVLECHITTGDSDYILRVAAADIESFRRFVMNDLLLMTGVDRTRSNISLGEIKYTTALPLDAIGP